MTRHPPEAIKSAGDPALDMGDGRRWTAMGRRWGGEQVGELCSPCRAVAVRRGIREKPG
jgi:hypothetical protein